MFNEGDPIRPLDIDIENTRGTLKPPRNTSKRWNIKAVLLAIGAGALVGVNLYSLAPQKIPFIEPHPELTTTLNLVGFGLGFVAIILNITTNRHSSS